MSPQCTTKIQNHAVGGIFAAVAAIAAKKRTKALIHVSSLGS